MGIPILSLLFRDNFLLQVAFEGYVKLSYTGISFIYGTACLPLVYLDWMGLSFANHFRAII
jgi:hypothetical protein